MTEEPGYAGPGTVLDIEGTKYIVLEEQGNNQVLVITVDSIGGSEIDNYLD